MTLINNSNFFISNWQSLDDFLTFQNVLTLLTFVGGGAAAIFAWLTNRDKQKLQAQIIADQKRLELELKEKEIELEQTKAQYLADLEIAKQRIQAELEDSRDNREFEQEQNRLSVAYQQSEMSIAHRLTAELLSTLIDYTTKQVTEALDKIKINSDFSPKIYDEINTIKYELRNLIAQQKIAVGLFTDEYEKHRKDRGKGNE